MVTKNRHLVSTILIISIGVFSTIDLILTIWAYYFAHPPFVELNPIADNILRSNNVFSLMLFKIVMLCFGNGVLWVFKDRLFTKISLWFVFTIYSWLMFVWFEFLINK